MTKKMRIVAYNPGLNVFVQFYEKNEWVQYILPKKDFEQLMIKDYPQYWEEWLEYEKLCDEMLFPSCDRFFFNYGRDYQIGETYVFE